MILLAPNYWFHHQRTRGPPPTLCRPDFRFKIALLVSAWSHGDGHHNGINLTLAHFSGPRFAVPANIPAFLPGNFCVRVRVYQSPLHGFPQRLAQQALPPRWLLDIDELSEQPTSTKKIAANDRAFMIIPLLLD